jgi:hypothetical protein
LDGYLYGPQTVLSAGTAMLEIDRLDRFDCSSAHWREHPARPTMLS